MISTMPLVLTEIRASGDSLPAGVDYAGKVLLGRLARSDSDPDHRQKSSSPYGIIVLENPGLTRGPEMILQIASIPDEGLKDMESD